jgi:peptidoglycan/LPS O-acetylase OafA/YrhL
LTINQEGHGAPDAITGRELGRASKIESAVLRAPARRLEYIDGLRALAALWVAAHHVFETSVPTRALSVPMLGPAIGTLALGQFPVMVFLMLSGFCLYYPYVKKSRDRPEFSGFRAYLSRRAMRIAPPYLWAGAFCLVIAAVPQLQVGRWKEVGTLDPKVILSHLLFVHNLIPSHAAKIDYPMWSIGLEWQLYLLFPLMVWGFRRSSGVVVITVALVVAAAIHATRHRLPEALGAALHDGPFAYLEIFGAGMLAASLTVRGQKVGPNWILGCVVVGGMTIVRFGSGNGLVHNVATSAAAFCVLLLAADPDGPVSRALSMDSVARVGLFSYSIYLVHAPLLHLAWFALIGLHLSPDTMFAVLMLGCLPPIVAVSYGFHCLFERPFMRVRPPRSANRIEQVGPTTGL